MLTNLTSSLTTIITSLYVHTGLAGIILAMAIESCCIPLPSEIVMPVAGVMIATGQILKGMSPGLSIVLVGLAGALGCLIGSMVAYGIGYSGGRPLMLRFGRYLLISQHDADRADAFFQKWGSATAFFSRLLPVVRTYISLPAGIAKMPFLKFCVYTFLGSFPWSLLLAYAGYVLGNHLTTLSPIFHSLDVVILLAVVVLVVLYVWRHIRNDRNARAAHAEGAAAASAVAQQANGAAWNQPQQGWGQPQSQPQPQLQPQQQFSQNGGQPPSQPAWGQSQAQPQQGWGQQPPQSPQSPQSPLSPLPPPFQQSQWNQFQPQPQVPQPPQPPQPPQQPQQGRVQPQIPQRPQATPRQSQWSQGQPQPPQPPQPQPPDQQQPWPPQSGR